MSKNTGTPSQSLQKELTQMYARTEHWISDYDFFEDEFNFLMNLMDKYFIGALIADQANNKKLRDLAGRLVKLDEARKHISALNKENLTYLARLIQNKEVFDPEECRDRQSDLESDHVDFLRKYRAIKKEVFQASDEILKSVPRKKLTD